MEKPVYIHYGDNKFVRPNPIKNNVWFTKPHGGLWASRKEGKNNWKDWCEREEFRLDTFDTSFEFTLKETARVLELNSRDQLLNLPKLQEYNPEEWYPWCCLDFEKLQRMYDAIEVTDICEMYLPLYGWDCNSILIMNPDIVEVV